MKLAVIPARGGSKRIPRKNIKLFGGRPMISWSIQAALDSGCFDKVIVSTDDQEIAEVAREWGAETPFVRPASLADDHTGTTAVISHAATWAIQAGWAPSHVCCIYATAPLLDAKYLADALTRLEAAQCDFVFSATSYAFPVQRAIALESDGAVRMLQPDQFNVRSQDLQAAFHDAGQFYWGTVQAWLSGRPIFGTTSRIVQLPRYRVQDIDDIEDWESAEILHAALQSRQRLALS